MRESIVTLVALLALGIAVVGASAQECNEYTRLDRLPDSFVVIEGGALPQFKMEHVSASDGVCTCDNQPEVDRVTGTLTPEGVNWSCRLADTNESKTVERGKE